MLRWLVAVVLLCSAWPSWAAPTVQDGATLLRAGQFEEAERVLRAVVAAEPERPGAWLLLGLAVHSQGRFEEALALHARATTFERVAGRAAYNAGCAAARLGRVPEAFRWLEKARDTRQVDMTQALVDADLADLRGHEHFGLLLASEEDHARPFVEEARILHDWSGDRPGGEFGWIARDIGDVDGDGVHDVVTSAPSRPEKGEQAGAVFVYSGASGVELWRAVGLPRDRLGLGVEAAGDVNADGIPDVVAGAPGSARVFVWSGRDGELIFTWRGVEGEMFGRKVSAAGDWNADGHDDVLVGAPRNDLAGEDAGRLLLMSGKDGEPLMEWIGGEPGGRFGSAAAGWSDGTRRLLVVGAPDAGVGNGGRAFVHVDLSGRPAFVVEPVEGSAELGGMFVSVVGDVNADGAPDVYVSDWADSHESQQRGRVVVHSGADGSLLRELRGETPGEGFGTCPAKVGDVDGDGHDDLLIGAWQHASAAPAGGKVTLYSGATGAVLRTWTGRIDGETLGFDAVGLGDVDGDGAIDYLVTSAWSSRAGYRSGRVMVLAGERP